MAYKFFDKRYLVMPYDRDIIGKRVFHADHLDMLICDVESGDLNKAGKIDDIFTGSGFSFYINNSHYNLAYYDPNYEAKIAYSQGKQIQVWSVSNVWENVMLPHWHEGYVYRVKPDEVWYVHQDIDGHYWKSDSDTITVEFKGTAEECDIWIAEHTPKSRRMTNKELARWLAEGKGQLKLRSGNKTTLYIYCGNDETFVIEGYTIRAWDSDEWHEPLVEVKE